MMFVDDHHFLAEVLASRLDGMNHDTTVIDVEQDILAQIQAHGSEGLVVLDLQLGENNPAGEEFIEPLLGLGFHVLVLSGVTDNHAFARCLELGAVGVLEKTADFQSLISLIDGCLKGESVPPGGSERARMARELDEYRRLLAQSRRPFEALSPKEQLVLERIMTGNSAAEISAEMFVSLATVRTQIKSVTRKLNVTSQLQAVALAHHVGWQPDASAHGSKPEPESPPRLRQSNANNRSPRVRR
ncbi:MAG: response regulator transcription factor [Acidimicrobiales bacterium]|nr:MAG: response regulator transcription factor [Acidimicrobiales bacterium]